MDSYTSAERRAQGRKLARARAAADEAIRVSKVMAQSAYAEGVPETQLAESFGVTRMTVRRWLGKL
ncbi:MAG: helix-turn-helix domain-containing protein [Mycobacterium sp.]